MTNNLLLAFRENSGAEEPLNEIIQRADEALYTTAGGRTSPVMERMKPMETAMTAWETLQAFCGAWFERRSAEETYLFLTDELCFVGTGENEFAHSNREMKEYLERDIKEIPEPFSVELTLFQEQEIDLRTCNIS